MLQRCLTGLLLAIVVFLVVFFSSPHAFFILSLLVYLLALFELCELVGIQSRTSSSFIITIGITLSVFCYLTLPIQWVVVLAGLYWAVMLFILGRYACSPYRLSGAQNSCAVIAFIALMLMWIAMNWLKVHWGAWPLLSIIGLVSIVDMGGYFGGRCWGKHSLLKRVSPGKTVEGAITAMLLALAYAGTLAVATQQPINRWTIAAVIILIVFSIVGDLVESMLKRMMQMKDSGRLLPGHGGLLDRIDGFVPVFPMAVFFYLIATKQFPGLSWLTFNHFVG